MPCVGTATGGADQQPAPGLMQMKEHLPLCDSEILLLDTCPKMFSPGPSGNRQRATVRRALQCYRGRGHCGRRTPVPRGVDGCGLNTYCLPAWSSALDLIISLQKGSLTPQRTAGETEAQQVEALVTEQELRSG